MKSLTIKKDSLCEDQRIIANRRENLSNLGDEIWIIFSVDVTMAGKEENPIELQALGMEIQEAVFDSEPIYTETQGMQEVFQR